MVDTHCAGRVVLIGLLLLAASMQTPVRAQAVRVFVTSKAGERLAPHPGLRFSAAPAHAKQAAGADQVSTPHVFALDPTRRLQRIDGFGASFQEAGAVVLNRLPEREREQVLAAVFDPVSGAGFSAMKTVIGGTDFQSAEPEFYSLAPKQGPPGDPLRHFSIERDLRPNGLIPYIRRAQRHGRFALQATMDYPPEWMLVQKKSYTGPDGKPARAMDVDPRFYATLADYYVRYLRAYAREGIHIRYLSPFNEPGIYTDIEPQEFAALAGGYVGPALARAHLGTRLQIGDFGSRVADGNAAGAVSDAERSLPIIMRSAGVRRYLGSISYHGYDFMGWHERKYGAQADAHVRAPTRSNGYDFAEFEAVARWHREYPSLPLWQTEVCLFDAMPWAGPRPVMDFSDGDLFGQQIAADLENGASAWLYWNLILDDVGGPWLVDPRYNNPEQNSQHPVVVIDRATRQVHYTGVYYYLAHFSKFVRPGSVRLAVSGGAGNLRALAFETPERGIVVEVLNGDAAATRGRLIWKGSQLEFDLAPKSITTLIWTAVVQDAG